MNNGNKRTSSMGDVILLNIHIAVNIFAITFFVDLDMTAPHFMLNKGTLFRCHQNQT